MNTDVWTAVLVTTIPVVGGGIGYLIKTLFDFRAENREDHDVVLEAIHDLKTDVREVRNGLHDHVSWHSKRLKNEK